MKLVILTPEPPPFPSASPAAQKHSLGLNSRSPRACCLVHHVCQDIDEYIACGWEWGSGKEHGWREVEWVSTTLSTKSDPSLQGWRWTPDQCPHGAERASRSSHEAGHPLPPPVPVAPSRRSEGKVINNNDNNRMTGRLTKPWLYICILSICGSYKEDTNELINKTETDPQA